MATTLTEVVMNDQGKRTHAMMMSDVVNDDTNKENTSAAATSPTTKKCTTCKEPHDLTSFTKGSYRCKGCERLYDKTRQKYAPATDGTKTCLKCNEVKHITSFNARSISQDGRRPTCRACDKADKTAHRQTQNGFLRGILDSSKLHSRRLGVKLTGEHTLN